MEKPHQFRPFQFYEKFEFGYKSTSDDKENLNEIANNNKLRLIL
jgi:hypothetical protein